MSDVQGTTTEQFAGLADQLQKNLESADVGASIAVYHHEDFVVDIWGGYRDEAKTTPWDRDTLVNVWSTTKTMTFLVALMLFERGSSTSTPPSPTTGPSSPRTEEGPSRFAT